MHQADPNGRLRLDKWLWAARFFKTRALASEAIDGGKVHVNGHAAKAAKEVKAGDVLHLSINQQRWRVTVLAVHDQRRPAPEARLLYEESEESRQRREAEREQHSLAPTPGADRKGRPSKKDRRDMQRFGGI